MSNDCLVCDGVSGDGPPQYGDYVICDGCDAGMGFEDYFQPTGEYGLPLYSFLDDHPIVDRVAERRAQWIASNYPVRERGAQVIAYSEVGGWTQSALADKLDVAESTVDSWVERVHAELGFAALNRDPPLSVDRELDVGVESGRECPVCGMERVCGVDEAKRTFRVKTWGPMNMLDEADVVCSYCHSVRIDDEWQRMTPVASRAWELAEASSSKEVGDYREILTSGISV